MHGVEVNVSDVRVESCLYGLAAYECVKGHHTVEKSVVAVYFGMSHAVFQHRFGRQSVGFPTAVFHSCKAEDKVCAAIPVGQVEAAPLCAYASAHFPD